MLRKLLCSACLLTLFAPWLLALGPAEKAPLYQHLLDVNAQWQNLTPAPELLQPVSFENDTRRIQAHLFHVEDYLRSKSTEGLGHAEQTKRKQLLDVLHTYAAAGVFPKNYDFNKRIPYFIDAHNTACAVGYLIIADGHQALAEKIRQHNNYQYLPDMDYPELTAWVAQSGFTAQELALIQPGYMGQTPFTTLPATGTGTNGTVNTLFSNQQTQELVAGGTFTEINGVSGFNNIALYTGTGWNDMDGGLNGTVHDVTIFNNQLYVAGEFSQSVSGVTSEGVIKWTGSAWEAVDAFGLYGDVYDLQVYNDKLYLGGDFLLPTGAPRGYLTAINDTAPELLQFFLNGPVHSMCVHNNELIVGGEYTLMIDTNTVSNLLRMDNQMNVYPFDEVEFNNPVLALASFNDLVVVGGAQQAPDDTVMSALAYYTDFVGWTDMSASLRPDIANSITSFLPDTSALYIGGNYACCYDWIIAYSGHGLGFLTYNSGSVGFAMMSVFDSSVNALTYYDDELVAGGSFNKIRYGTQGAGPVVTVDNLGGIALQREGVTGVTTYLQPYIKVYPVPASDFVQFSLYQAIPDLKLTITNISGQVIYETDITGSTCNVSVSQWPAGMYFYQLQSPHGTQVTDKFIIE